ncbi:MAG TPA: SET domain-containing methyltransferase [Candidatus Kryptonia bacterium]
MALSKKVIVETRKDNQRGLFAVEEIVRDEVLLTFDGPILDHPTRYSIQIDDDKHIEGTDDSNAYLNHSCNANTYVDWKKLCLLAKRSIKAGEEVTNNYLTTDYELTEPFTCTCGSPNCVGEVRGFKYLTREEQVKLRPWLPPFLLGKLD